ncbi:MAG TPA: M24 family metallopeptidase [Syntrophorhabdaceae bacterium]|nr:M24 family metallopeptidase [Syntrophorhabdaceae bacterium]
MGISLQEFQRRYKEIRDVMKQEHLDSLLIVGINDDFNRGNLRYITGLGRGGCCIFPAEGMPVLLGNIVLTSSRKLPRFMAAVDLLELKTTSEPEREAIEQLRRFDGGGRIGLVGKACMPAPMYAAVMEKFGNRIIDAAGIFEGLRAVKSPEEIERMRTGALIADTIYRRLREIIRPGLGEYEIYGEVKKIIYGMGCEYSFDLIDAAGSTMNMSFVPTVDRLESNGTLFMEITPSYDGYYCQLPVTLPVHRYSPAVKEMVSTWNETDQAARQLLRPGTKVSDLYQVLVDKVQERGFISPFRPGHSIGLDVLDFWSVTESNSLLLKAGMTIAVHACVLKEMGGDGCGMGYTYLITDTGWEKLSKIDLAEELLGN